MWTSGKQVTVSMLVIFAFAASGFFGTQAGAQVPTRSKKADRLPVQDPSRFGGDVEDWDERARPGRQSPIPVSEEHDPLVEEDEALPVPPRNIGRSDEVPTAPRNVRTTGACAGMTQKACEVVSFTNIERRRQGVPLLRLDLNCQRAANDHARDMATRRYFAHVSPDGGTLKTRYNRYGRSVIIGENLVMGQGMSPSQAVDAWMNSPAHRENLLNPEFGSIGIGIAEGGGSTYYVQCLSK